MRFSSRGLVVVGMAASFGVGWGVGCGSTDLDSPDASAPPRDGGAEAETGNVNATLCPPCVTSNDCDGGVCAQLGSDSYCAPSCGAANACATGRTCMSETSFSGDQVDVCVADDNACGAPAGPTGDGGGTSTMCGPLVA